MRMWMVDPILMCRKHLLGEHGEIHKFRHNFVKGHRIDGRRGQIDPLLMKDRHDDLAAEMIKRGYNHQSPYEMPDLSHYSNLEEWHVDNDESYKELLSRCKDCALLWRE